MILVTWLRNGELWLLMVMPVSRWNSGATVFEQLMVRSSAKTVIVAPDSFNALSARTARSAGDPGTTAMCLSAQAM